MNIRSRNGSIFHIPWMFHFQSSSVEFRSPLDAQKRDHIHPYSSIWCVNVFSVLNLNIFSMACKPSIFEFHPFIVLVVSCRRYFHNLSFSLPLAVTIIHLNQQKTEDLLWVFLGSPMMPGHIIASLGICLRSHVIQFSVLSNTCFHFEITWKSFRESLQFLLGHNIFFRLLAQSAPI